MKTSFTVFFVLVIIVLGCGKDGIDGKAYLKISWDPYVYAYWDDNPETPDTIEYREAYRVYPGSYQYEYLWKDLQGNSYREEGTYEIFINKGEKGKFLKAGNDGETEYFHIHLSEDNDPNLTVKSANTNRKNELSVAETEYPECGRAYFSKFENDTSYSHGFVMIVSKKKFRLKK